MAVLSPKLNPLQNQGLSATLPQFMAKLAEAVRLRIREEMARKDMSQRDLAGLLDWSQSRVAHLLTGRVEISLDDLEGFGFALGLAPTELVRDRGLEFVTEMTPTELRLFERLRALGPDQRDAILTILNVQKNDTRRALPPKTVRTRRG